MHRRNGLKTLICVTAAILVALSSSAFARNDRGFINEPFDYDRFYERYGFDEFVILGTPASTRYTQGWTNATYLRTAGGEQYTVVNCDEYAPARVEADDYSKILQRFYLGSTVTVVGLWRDWAVCQCDSFRDSYVCGWVNQKYLNVGVYDVEWTSPLENTTSASSDRYDLSQYGYLSVITKGRGALFFQSSPRGSFMSNHKFRDGDQVYVNLNWQNNGYAIAYENGEYGYVDASYIDWDGIGSINLKNDYDNAKDLSNYEYRQVIEKGRGPLIFQKSPRGSFMSNFKYHDGDWIYVNLYWREDGYAIAYESETYGYVDASYIDW